MRPVVMEIDGKKITYDVMEAVSIIKEYDWKEGRFIGNLIDMDVELDEAITKLIRMCVNRNKNPREYHCRILEKCQATEPTEKLINKYVNEYLMTHELGELISEEEYNQRFEES
jgi:hypothetical protein